MQAKVHRHLAKNQEWLGLEPIDALALGGVFWLLLTFNRGQIALNFLVLVVGYVVLRIAKRGKPAGYTTALIKYSLRVRRSYLSAGKSDLDGRAHTFGGRDG